MSDVVDVAVKEAYWEYRRSPWFLDGNILALINIKGSIKDGFPHLEILEQSTTVQSVTSIWVTEGAGMRMERSVYSLDEKDNPSEKPVSVESKSLDDYDRVRLAGMGLLFTEMRKLRVLLPTVCQEAGEIYTVY